MVIDMKKIIIILFFLAIITVSINEKENILIPNDAIRFRIIANSNSKEDQDLKKTIKNDVEEELFKLLKNDNNIDDARIIINNNLSNIDNIVKKYNVSYDISYGNNYFPIKEYKGIKYNAGNYESLVIKLGNAVGDNWWCVLFPPLCLLDEKNNINNYEYKLYANELINKFTNK